MIFPLIVGAAKPRQQPAQCPWRGKTAEDHKGQAKPQRAREKQSKTIGFAVILGNPLGLRLFFPLLASWPVFGKNSLSPKSMPQITTKPTLFHYFWFFLLLFARTPHDKCRHLGHPGIFFGNLGAPMGAPKFPKKNPDAPGAPLQNRGKNRGRPRAGIWGRL